VFGERMAEAVLIVGLVALLAGACGSTGVAAVDRTAVCTGNNRPDLCNQAFDAVLAELGGVPPGTSVRIDPMRCTNELCWTWAYVSSPGEGPDQKLSIDWEPDGRISISHVAPG
jgi:hypothetical protein